MAKRNDKHTQNAPNEIVSTKVSPDLTGQRFGRLTVLRRYGRYGVGSPHKQISTWECKCDCGNKHIARRDHLKNGVTKSCGCLQKEKAALTGKDFALAPGVASFNSLVLSYRRHAKNRQIAWNLTSEQAKELFQSKCYYCGIEPSASHSNGRSGEPFIYNGIDRVDSDGDYSIENTVTCCKICNYAKHTQTKEEFLKWIKRVYEFTYC